MIHESKVIDESNKGGLMICRKCKEQGLKSQIYNLGSQTTLMGTSSFYDENGKYLGKLAKTVMYYHISFAGLFFSFYMLQLL